MAKYIIEAFLLGISMGGYCAVSCAPFVVPYILANPQNGYSGRIYVFLQFLSGRLLAYMLFAGAASMLAISSGQLFSLRVNSILLIAASLIMIIFSIVHTNIRFCHFAKLGAISRGFPAVTGFILGLNLCPPFLVALVNVISMKSIVHSCVYFFFLFLGTTVYLLPVVVVSVSLKSDFFRRIGMYLGILTGAWFLIQGIAGLL